MDTNGKLDFQLLFFHHGINKDIDNWTEFTRKRVYGIQQDLHI